MANEYLTRTPTSSGNRKVWTWATWFKLNETTPAVSWAWLFNTSVNGGILINYGGTPYNSVISWYDNGAAQSVFSEASFRDTNSWYHLVVNYDSTLVEERERVKFYMNGQKLDYTTNTNISQTFPSQNFEANWNDTIPHSIGRWELAPGRYIKAQYLDQFFIDGQALTPDVFGFYKDGDGYQSSGTIEATDFRPGQWSPRLPKSIKYTINRSGGFGVNGFYLPMNDSSNTGADFHCDPNSIIKLKGEDLPQPRNGAPTTTDAYVSQLRQETGTLGFDGVVKFDGVDDYLSFADSSDWDVGTSAFTIECFINVSSSSTDYSGIFGMHTGSVQFQWRLNTQGRLQFLQDFGGTRGNTDDADTTGTNLRDNSWHHIAMTRQSDNSWQLYVDGMVNYSGTGMTGDITGINEVAIGRRADTDSFYLNGFISNFRFVNGTALYAANFTPPTEPLTDVTNTVLLCCNSSTSAIAATVTPDTITNNGAFATRNELTGSLILACPFVAGGFGQNGAENTTIPGLGDYHIALGGPSSVPAVNWLIASGNQAQITGDNGLYYGSSLDVTNSNINPRATVGTAFTPDGDFTVEFWCYINSFNSGGTHIIQYDSDAGATGWLVSFDSGNIRWMLRNSSGQDVQVSVANVVIAQQWNHFAGVYNSSRNTMTAYLNGVAVGTTTVASNYLSTQYTNLNRIHIGSNVGNGSRPMEGYMSDLRIYKGVAKYKGGFDVPKPYTPVGIEPFRTTADTCKNNFATFNPIFGIGRQNQLAYSNGNLTVTSSATSGSDTTSVSTTAIKGKIYCEFYIPSDAIGVYVGAAKYNTPFADGIDTTASSDCWLVRGDTGNKANGESGSGLAYGGSFSNGDVIMMAADIENGSIWWGRNGSWTASGNPATNSNAAYTNLPSTDDLLVMCGDNYSDKIPTIHANFGQNETFTNLKAVNKNRVNNGTADSVWHQSSNTGNHNDWTASSGGTKLDVAVSGGNYARAKLRAVDGTIDPKKTYLLSFKYVTGPSNLGVQNDQGYMTAVDGSASPAGLSSGNYYSFIIQGTREFNFTGFTGSTYSLDEIVVSEIDECYTDTSGKGKFHYEPPTGFLALCEDNLPTPAIADPGKYFKAVLYKNSQKISNVGFKPDLIWNKSRNQLYSHYLYDSVRGVGGTGLNSDKTDSEGTNDAGGILSFDDDGFTLSTDAGLAQTEAVAWCWKAGGAAVSNSDGSITSQVSANPEAGFSIISYTGNGTAGANVGHGLLQAPELMIHKSRDQSRNWYTITTTVDGSPDYLYLNLTNQANDSAVTAPTSSLMYFTSSAESNNLNEDYIAYCWHSVEAYSKFGIYDGNSSSDGPFVYCGFKPALILAKCITNPGGDWIMKDSSRYPSNNENNGQTLVANVNKEEDNYYTATQVQIDLLSNGFKIRHSGGPLNDTGRSYIYCAWAESPFQTANAK